jgi:hypothetical protein
MKAVAKASKDRSLAEFQAVTLRSICTLRDSGVSVIFLEVFLSILIKKSIGNFSKNALAALLFFLDTFFLGSGKTCQK